MHVASIIDSGGSPLADTHESYWHRATGGRYPPADLALGQALLIDIGLVVEDGAMLRPTAELAELLGGTAEDALPALIARLAASDPEVAGSLARHALSDLIPDADRREELLLQLAQRADDKRNVLVGNAGERLVVAEARSELEQLDRSDLAREVRRVSLTSDQLGYDVRAPRVQGSPRRLEVKATTAEDMEWIKIFISRNEVDTGMRVQGWSLVVCRITDIENAAGSVLGWWSYDDLAQCLPRDVGGGAWRLAELTLRLEHAHSGLPSAVL